jgi:hypothetical protein
LAGDHRTRALRCESFRLVLFRRPADWLIFRVRTGTPHGSSCEAVIEVRVGSRFIVNVFRNFSGRVSFCVYRDFVHLKSFARLIQFPGARFFPKMINSRLQMV